MEVKIYTAPACSWCKQLKEWLKKNKVNYQELNVAESETAREELIKLSHQMAVPVIEAAGKIIIGFDQKKLEEVVKKRKSGK